MTMQQWTTWNNLQKWIGYYEGNKHKNFFKMYRKLQTVGDRFLDTAWPIYLLLTEKLPRKNARKVTQMTANNITHMASWPAGQGSQLLWPDFSWCEPADKMNDTMNQQPNKSWIYAMQGIISNSENHGSIIHKMYPLLICVHHISFPLFFILLWTGKKNYSSAALESSLFFFL